MRLNRRKLRILIESIIHESPQENKPEGITDLLAMVARSYKKELDAFNPLILAMVASGNAENLMAVYERGSKSFEDKEAGLKAVFERMQELARNYNA